MRPPVTMAENSRALVVRDDKHFEIAAEMRASSSRRRTVTGRRSARAILHTSVCTNCAATAGPNTQDTMRKREKKGKERKRGNTG